MVSEREISGDAAPTPDADADELTRLRQELAAARAELAATAIENARLFQALQDRTAQLSRSVEELQALGEVSQAVSSSLDLQEVLTTIVAHATRLADADGGTIYQLDDAGEQFILRAAYLMPP